MTKDFLAIVFLLLCLGLAFSEATSSSAYARPAPQMARSGFKVREPNLYAPNLYADNIGFEATLVDLPGFNKNGSYWELSYQLYFVPEASYYDAIKQLPRGGSNPTPEQFPGRILLAEGHKKVTHLATLKERAIALSGVHFKDRVPDAQRTKFSYLMTSYSVKIVDAELGTTIYRSGIFLAEPFVADPNDQKQAIARKTIYLTFGVNSDGTLNRSQLAPRD